MGKIEFIYNLFSQYSKVVIDSRQVESDCLFFALKGERFNGNEFAAQAIQNGAAYAIIDEPEYQKNDRYILVPDSLESLQKLANHHRRQFQVPVIAITGSNGKTTTKELINCVLSSHYKAHCTKGNFNNHIGVPLTLLSMPLDTKVAIIEMGANHQGEIGFLCEIVEPTHGLITNIGKAHLEGFGGIEGVKKGKSELYRYLSKYNGVAFINQDEQFLNELSTGVRWRIFYKNDQEPTSDTLPFCVSLKAKEPFVKAIFISDEGDEVTISSQLVGSYNFNNIMTAVVLGTYFKVPGEKIKKAIEAYVPSNNRSQLVIVRTNTFLLDAYNANPTSMKNALLSFSKMQGEKKIAILGSMKELGDYSKVEHQEIFKLATSLNFDLVVFVGDEYKMINSNDVTKVFENVDDFKIWFAKRNFFNTIFLLKGSRSVGLEKLLQ